MTDGMIFFTIFYGVLGITFSISTLANELDYFSSYLTLLLAIFFSPILIPVLVIMYLGIFLSSYSPRDLLNYRIKLEKK